jgi:hypothetical protein
MQRIYLRHIPRQGTFLTGRPRFPASWRSPGDRELCMDADLAGSHDREPASKITPM